MSKSISMTNKYHTECAINIDSVNTEILADFSLQWKTAYPSSHINTHSKVTEKIFTENQEKVSCVWEIKYTPIGLPVQPDHLSLKLSWISGVNT